MPASMGMMMLGRLIMSLIGDADSWDQSSLMSGMMGGMGGGGFRSVPPTSLPFATLKPGQTRNLPTRLVALTPPTAEKPLAFPAKGEKLQIGDIDATNNDPRVQKALKRLAAEKAPTTVSQLVMWRVASKLGWDAIAEMSAKWSNAHELSLARAFVEKLDTLPEGESSALLCEIRGTDGAQTALATELVKQLDGQYVLGLPVKSTVPAQPDGPAVACRVQLTGTAEKPEAQVVVLKSDAPANAWVPVGKFTLPVTSKDGKVEVAPFANALSEGILNRLVRAQLSKGAMVKGKQTYKIKVENASPLILNGLAIQGNGSPTDEPKVLAGLSIPPFKNLTVPATGDVVTQLGLKLNSVIRVSAADLSGL